MEDRFEEKKMGVFGKVKYWFNGFDRNLTEHYNRIVRAYNSENYENALREVWETWYLRGSTTIPDFYRIVLAVINNVDPENEVFVRGKAVSGLSTLWELWVGRHETSKGAEGIYETTFDVAERLDPEKRYPIYGQDVSVASLLAVAWSCEDVYKVPKLSERTVDLLKKIPEMERRQTIDSIEYTRKWKEQSIPDERNVMVREEWNKVLDNIKFHEEYSEVDKDE